MRILWSLFVGAATSLVGTQAVAAQPLSVPTGIASPGTPLLPEQLEKIFLSACFDGTMKLPAEEERPITIGELPPDLRRSFGTPLSGSVWRLNGTTPTYLYTMNYKAGPTSIPKVCGLATQSIEIGPAMEFLGARLDGPSLTSLHESYVGADWLNAQGGYDAAAYKIDRFTVLELKMLSKEQQRRALKLVPTLDHYFPAQ